HRNRTGVQTCALPIFVDDYTVNIHTKQPFAALPAHLAHPGGHMISKEVIDKDYAEMEEGGNPLTEVNKTPVGTGFFKFEDITEGEQITLVRKDRKSTRLNSSHVSI